MSGESSNPLSIKANNQKSEDAVQYEEASRCCKRTGRAWPTNSAPHTFRCTCSSSPSDGALRKGNVRYKFEVSFVATAARCSGRGVAVSHWRISSLQLVSASQSFYVHGTMFASLLTTSNHSINAMNTLLVFQHLKSFEHITTILLSLCYE